MEAYKTRSFANWAMGESLDDDALTSALQRAHAQTLVIRS
jgi:hypothetical protein